MHELARAAGDLDDLLRHRAQGHLARIADVDGSHVIRAQQAPDALHQVVHVAEGARLRSVSEQRHVLAEDRLPEEVRDRAAVLDLHAGAEGVEDAHDADVDAVVAVVGHRHRLGETFCLVVDAADADRVHVAPVRFGLRVHLRVAVGLRGAREQQARALRLGEAQRLVGAERADLQDLDRQALEVRRARRRGEVQDRVERAGDEQEVRHVVVLELELRVAEQRLDVLDPPGQQVVDRDHLAALVEQTAAEVRADEAGAPGDQDPLQGSLRAHAAFPSGASGESGELKIGLQRVPPAREGARRAPRPSSSPAPNRSDAAPAGSSPASGCDRPRGRRSRPHPGWPCATSHQVASPRFARWYRPRRLGFDQGADPGGEVRRVGGPAALVVDDAQRRAVPLAPPSCAWARIAAMKFRPRPKTQLVRTTSADGQRASTRCSPASLLRPYSERGRGRIVLPVRAGCRPRRRRSRSRRARAGSRARRTARRAGRGPPRWLATPRRGSPASRSGRRA